MLAHVSQIAPGHQRPYFDPEAWSCPRGPPKALPIGHRGERGSRHVSEELRHRPVVHFPGRLVWGSDTPHALAVCSAHRLARGKWEPSPVLTLSGQVDELISARREGPILYVGTYRLEVVGVLESRSDFYGRASLLVDAGLSDSRRKYAKFDDHSEDALRRLHCTCLGLNGRLYRQLAKEWARAGVVGVADGGGAGDSGGERDSGRGGRSGGGGKGRSGAAVDGSAGAMAMRNAGSGEHEREREQERERQLRRRSGVYYCGGPYKEQAGTVPTYIASRIWFTKKLGQRDLFRNTKNNGEVSRKLLEEVEHVKDVLRKRLDCLGGHPDV
ncbi:hypothetical protein FB451DRAFT_1190427 [Mycena latifolia]|nr:hypothetical protein FB451DRAFT_1190427 [Mycena latifolia]